MIENNFSIHQSKLHDNVTQKSHETYEIWYLIKGKKKFFIGDGSFIIKSGNLILINKNRIHRFIDLENEQEPHRFVIEFREKFINKNFHYRDYDLFDCFKKDLPIFLLDFEEQNITEGKLMNIYSEYKAEEEGFQIGVLNKLIDLLLYFNRLIRKNPDLNNIEYSDAKHKEIAKVTEYINNNFSEELSLKVISEKFNFSRYHFCRTFKKVTDFTFKEYLNLIRVKEAKRILRTSNLNITEISHQVGYNSLIHFDRKFKEIVGKTPSEYRKLKSKYI